MSDEFYCPKLPLYWLTTFEKICSKVMNMDMEGIESNEEGLKLISYIIARCPMSLIDRFVYVFASCVTRLLQVHPSSKGPNHELVRLILGLLKTCPQLCAFCGTDGQYPIFHAVACTYPIPPIVYHIMANAHPEAVLSCNSDGENILHSLLSTSPMNVTAVHVLLLSCPASARAKTNKGKLPIHTALSFSAFEHSLPAIELLTRVYPMGTHMEAVDEILQLGWGDASSNNHKKKRITWTPLDRARDRGLDETADFMEYELTRLAMHRLTTHLLDPKY